MRTKMMTCPDHQKPDHQKPAHPKPDQSTVKYKQYINTI